jgi:GTP-binding protein
MAFDTAKLWTKAGDGGAGVISFRREKFVPEGGPDGGDGGRGGSVYVFAEKGASTLRAYQHRRHIRAEPGGKGGGNQRHGKKGADVRLPVPSGTLVYDDATGELLADLSEPGAEVMVARGGRGGLGNSHFKTSTNQAPRIAQKGEPGEERWTRLELKLIADVGIVGLPNAGKSTLLASVSRAQPKIADYPFTTLEPNLGVVEVDDETMVLADIPGLIEGAHHGIGLGHSFLRHVERTRVLIHLVDGGVDDPSRTFDAINEELELFDPKLRAKPQVVAINKIDLPEVRARLPELVRQFGEHGLDGVPISAATGEGVPELMRRVMTVLRQERARASLEPRPDGAVERVPVLRPAAADAFEVLPEPGGFRVAGKRVERAVAMTDLENEEAVAFLRRVLERMGVSAALERAGVKPGDPVRFGKEQLRWE